MQKIFSSSWKVLMILTGLSLVMRVFSYFPSVLDHDESTYIIIGDALRHGHVYLRDVMDTKPIGIFILFAIFQILFGKAIFIIRLVTAVWVALTGWMIYLVHLQFIAENSTVEKNPAPFASGLIYIIITSLFSNYGLSPNTELFFGLFTIIALFLILRFHRAGWFFLAGLLLGLGFMIKYVVLFDAVAIGLFYIWQQVTAGKHWPSWLIRCMLMVAGFIIPFFIVWVYYRHLGMEDKFLFYSFKVSGGYFIKPLWYTYFIYLFHSFFSFLPVVIWFFFCIKNWRTTGPALPFLGIIWGVLVIVIILLPGRMFAHYFIQIMLPLSLIAGSFFDPRRKPGRALSWMRNPSIGYTLLFLFIIVNMIFQKINLYDKKDYPREVAAYLNTRLQRGDILYTGDYQQIIYLLTGTNSPTPYIHSSLIWRPENNRALHINPSEEFDKILRQHPRYILIRYPLLDENPLHNTLLASYSVVKTFDKEVMVYERN